MKTSDSKSPMKRDASPTVMGRVKTAYPRLQRILVPLDFSGRSRQALRYAVPLAERFSARIVLFHAIEPVAVSTAGLALVGVALAEARRAAVRRLAGTAATLIPGGMLAKCVVRTGPPAAEILAAVEREDIDLVVMSTRGRTALKRLLLGSTAERVMQRASCPVLSVRRR